MDFSHVKSLNECLEKIEDIELVCQKKFSPAVCKNFQGFYRNYCYRQFEKNETCSSFNTLGGNTLNLINKSPPPPL